MQEFHGSIIQERKTLVQEGHEETRRKDLTAKDADRRGSGQAFIGAHSRHSQLRLNFAFLRVLRG
jgi:hypothetical protein